MTSLNLDQNVATTLSEKHNLNSFRSMHTDTDTKNKYQKDVSLAMLRKMPKVELHAHLFGSISRDFLRSFAMLDASNEDVRGSNDGYSVTDDPKGRNMVTAFEYFPWVYRCVRDLSTMEKMTKHVLEFFHKDNVVYLELRTTLKSIPETDVNPFNYMEMLNSMVEWSQETLGMKVRLIISVDRTKCQTAESAACQFEWVKEALASQGKYVVGLDICGNPQAENMTYVFQEVDKLLLDPSSPYSHYKWTCHTAETDREQESWEILRRKPNRIGHGCYLTPAQKNYVFENRIVVESCPTSNLSTMELENIRSHPYATWYGKISTNKGFCISTDDSGLFETTLSQDLEIVAKEFNWFATDLVELQEMAVQHSFLPQDEKQEVLAVMRKKMLDWLTLVNAS